MRKYATQISEYSLYLKSIINHTPPNIICLKYSVFLEMAKKIGSEWEVMILGIIAGKFVIHPPRTSKEKVAFMTNAWSKVKESKNAEYFIDATANLCDFALKYLSTDKAALLEEVFQTFKGLVSTSFNSEQVIRGLEKLIRQLLISTSSTVDILNIDSLLPLFDFFSDSVKQKLCSTLILSVINSSKNISDPVIAHTLIKIGKY